MTMDRPPARPNDSSVPDVRGPTSFYLVPERAGPGPREPDFQRVKAILRRRRWTMLAGFLGVFGAVVALTLLLPKKYESTASFLIEQPEGRTNVPALAVLERLGRLASRETEVELIQSRRVVEPVVEAFNLHVRVETPAGRVRPEEVFPGLRVDVAAIPGRYELSRNGQGGYAVTEETNGRTLWNGKPGTTLRFKGVSGGARLTEQQTFGSAAP